MGAPHSEGVVTARNFSRVSWGPIENMASVSAPSVAAEDDRESMPPPDAEPPMPPPAVEPSMPPPASGDKRKERLSIEPSETPVSKKPHGDEDLKAFLNLPPLTVDTSLFEDPDEPIVPRTPANVRSMHRTDMHAAVCAGDVQKVTALLEGGHAVDPQEEHGFTPLHNACALDKPAARASLVTLLLAHSADPCRADNEGYTCLHWASACGAANVLQPLLDAGAQPSQRSNTGESAPTPTHTRTRARLEHPHPPLEPTYTSASICCDMMPDISWPDIS